MANDNHEQGTLDMQSESKQQGPVDCLGLTFPDDDARRAHFLGILQEKLEDPEFRKIEGFPIGSDEDILALSDPPYYTACPNPFTEDFIRFYGKPYDPNDAYKREPFAADVSEGKNDPIYNAHSYHTKVPHKAIMRYILHYTEPGDVVFDGFCGTGMTGVAAQLCGDKMTVESMGYNVDKDGTIFQQETDNNGKTVWESFSKLGARHAILNDLSPAATFIAYNFNTPVDVAAFEHEAKCILKEVEAECGWMYETLHTDGKAKGRINYTVWSDVFICPECTREVVFWEAAVDKEAGKVSDEFPCTHCNASLTKRRMDRAYVTFYDSALHISIQQAKQIPVLISYHVGRVNYEKEPDKLDLTVIEKISESDIPYWFPTNRLFEGGETRRNDIIGITHVHQFYTRRNIWILAALRERFKHSPQMMLLFTSQLVNMSRLNRYRPGVSFPYNPLSGTLYVGSQISESNIFVAYYNKMRRFVAAYKQLRTRNTIGCNSTTHIGMSDASCDYVFTDPPFGGNLAYAELNVLWEEWLQVLTSRNEEAIESKHQNKGLPEYQALMTACFKEYYRVLKSGRWMTVEFHNSKNSVWNAIQVALQNAGFVIADVRTLDKQQGTFKQVTSGGAVKQDLIISAYKPNGGLEERFKLEAGTEEGVWDFIRTHLKQLPVFVPRENKAETIAERQNYLLFDRMVAFHVQRGVTVPLSAAEFYTGLQRFPERDGMYFLPEQAAEYDKKRMTVKDVLQLQLFVSDESTAIQWLRQQLTRKPQTAGELKPQFMQEMGGWQKTEKLLELDELLEQNFLRYDGKGAIPTQLVSWMKQSEELRIIIRDELESGRAIEENGRFSTRSTVLIARAKDRYYVPDPNKSGDLEKLRERTLLREFDEYKQSSQKRLKVFRLEAVRAGFKKAWQEKSNDGYRTIIEVARKIPESVLQEDPKLLMWYDQAITRLGGAE
ncbi:MAG: DNA methylase [bacterium ADurb.Bin236]|nr:MAG: DNA methylase [bacterium ADurb.Bin236]